MVLLHPPSSLLAHTILSVRLVYVEKTLVAILESMEVNSDSIAAVILVLSSKTTELRSTGICTQTDLYDTASRSHPATQLIYRQSQQTSHTFACVVWYLNQPVPFCVSTFVTRLELNSVVSFQRLTVEEDKFHREGGGKEFMP